MSPQDTLKKYEIEINKHEFDFVAPLISDNATFWFSDGSFEGKHQIKAVFEKTWGEIKNEVYWIENQKWIAESPSVATCIYEFNWKGEVNGTICSGRGRGTTIMRLEDGNWKIIHEHLSQIPK